MKTLRLRQQRGQAAVELSLLSILIIPIFLYIIFLDDLLRFKQDQQEAIIVSAWDFTTLNYDHQTHSKGINKKEDYLPNQPAPTSKYPTPFKKNHASHVSYYARQMYADHTAATPRFEDTFGDDEKHHLAVGAHQCWLVGDRENQVWCVNKEPDLGTSYTPDGTLFGGREAVHGFLGSDNVGRIGGLYECKGRVGVTNHWLPTGNMWFTKEELTRTKFHGVTSGQAIGFDGSDVHKYKNAKEAYHFPYDVFGVVTNPWAMSEQDDAAGGDRGFPLYDRVNKVYTSPGPIGAIGIAFVTYPVRALQQQLIGPGVLADLGPLGDMIFTPEVAFSKNVPSPQVNGFYSSQSKDWAGDDVIQHYKARGDWYLGAKNRP